MIFDLYFSMLIWFINLHHASIAGLMDNLNVLIVRFYLGGQFVHYEDSTNYIGGDEAISHIDRDKVSLPEIVGHLKDHMVITEKDNIYLHWLFPSKELNNGLRMLSDDKVCEYMSECITDGAVADVYAEVIHESEDEDDESDYEYEMEETNSEDDVQVVNVPIQLVSPSKCSDLNRFRASYKSSKQISMNDATEVGKGKQKIQVQDEESDYNSAVDEEAKENRKVAKMANKGIQKCVQERFYCWMHEGDRPGWLFL